MSPRERGAWLAEQTAPLTDAQVEAAARILASADGEQVAA